MEFQCRQDQVTQLQHGQECIKDKQCKSETEKNARKEQICNRKREKVPDFQIKK